MLKKFKNNITYFILCILLIITSCNKFDKAPNGLHYKMYNQSKSERKPQVGEVVLLNFTMQNEEDSLIFSTYQNNSIEYIKIQQASHTGGDIYSALQLMSVGDSMQFYINADSFYSKTKFEERPKNVNQNSKLLFTAFLIAIKTEAEIDKIKQDLISNRDLIEKLNIESYCKETNYKYIKTPSGILAYFFKNTNEKAIIDGNMARFHFIGSFLNKAEFANSYTSGMPAYSKIGEIEPLGLNECLKMMKQSEKAIFVLPSRMAYGASGYSNIISPYTPIIYEINLLKIK